MQLRRFTNVGVVGGMFLSALAGAWAAPKSLLAPVAPRIVAAVRQVQPNASFGFYRDILIGQYRTDNYTIKPPAVRGHKPCPYQELGPRRGGFYLQVEVKPRHGQATHVTPPDGQRPWTTVTSFYPVAAGGQAIMMTWEAGPGAPRGLAEKIAHILMDRAAGR